MPSRKYGRNKDAISQNQQNIKPPLELNFKTELENFTE